MLNTDRAPYDSESALLIGTESKTRSSTEYLQKAPHLIWSIALSAISVTECLPKVLTYKDDSNSEIEAFTRRRLTLLEGEMKV